eukprot:scaffold39887_cov229-Amphora_coffeaeformis.AAC.11
MPEATTSVFQCSTVFHWIPPCDGEAIEERMSGALMTYGFSSHHHWNHHLLPWLSGGTKVNESLEEEQTWRFPLLRMAGCKNGRGKVPLLCPQAMVSSAGTLGSENIFCMAFSNNHIRKSMI